MNFSTPEKATISSNLRSISRFAIPKTATNQFVGRLSMHRDGYGFVIPNRSNLKEPLRSQLSGDVFIAPHQIGSSMHGDQVLVEVSA